MRALEHELKTGWENGLPSIMFTLCFVPHDPTRFSLTESFSGTTFLTPLSLVCEVWEENERHTSGIDNDFF